jgi:hypothetical protein
MGFLGNLFGKGNHNNSNDDSDQDFGERLSDADAEDIYMSSGQDPDYDFRSTDDYEEDGPIPDDFDPEKQTQEYIDLHPNDALQEPAGVAPEFEEHASYVFVCINCEGRGYVIVPDPYSSQADISECDYCYGTRERELEGWEAEEKLLNGDVPLRVNK